MRDYSKVGPQFWIGPTGKKLRAAGMEAQIVAMYLLTSPHANMLGLYYCPVMFIAHETGLGIEGANKGLQRAIEADFCQYDEASEVVWVMEMASYQVGEALKANDLRVKGVQNEYASLPENPYLARFYEKYSEAFCMSSCRGNSSPYEAPMKTLASQEQEQEQEKEQEQEQKEKGAGAPASLDSHGTDDQGSLADGGKGGGKLPRELGVRELVAEGVERQHAEDWLKARRAKKLPLTETALDLVKTEAGKAGLTLPQAIARAAGEGWAGFKASWLSQPPRHGGPRQHAPVPTQPQQPKEPRDVVTRI
ncbi:hypothetical protein [Pandoraea apista]|uniref:hypothetical protein n=1 Tax=Pandoraea apista TaxID=93218 RepID=UPI000699AB59|nr:hypothetical protein [Pandoraea apista]